MPRNLSQKIAKELTYAYKISPRMDVKAGITEHELTDLIHRAGVGVLELGNKELMDALWEKTDKLLTLKAERAKAERAARAEGFRDGCEKQREVDAQLVDSFAHHGLASEVRRNVLALEVDDA